MRKYRTPHEGFVSGSNNDPVIRLPDRLYLLSSPIIPRQAVTLEYLTLHLDSLNASDVTLGTLSKSYLPGMTGDITVLPGSWTITLPNKFQSTNAFTKVTVNTTGFITAGGIIQASDIPSVTWSHLKNTPILLSDYGISDAVSFYGDTVTSPISITYTPVNNYHAVNKSYIDTTVASAMMVKTGTIIESPVNTGLSGFLFCNGAELNKLTYANLYAILGDTFSITSFPGGGQPWRQQFNIASTQTGDISNWTTGPTLLDWVSYSQAIVTKNKVHLIAGWAGGSLNSTYYANINADGSLGSWNYGTSSLPKGLANAQAFVIKNKAYILTGKNSLGNETVHIYVATINSDGTLGTWTAGVGLPFNIFNSQVLVTTNYVYLLGGNTGVPINDVWQAPINSDGTLGAWTLTVGLPVNLSNSHLVVTNNRVYLLGGNTNLSYVNTVYSAPINPDGTLGTWRIETPLPAPIAQGQVVVTRNMVYLFGGYNGTNYLNTMYMSPINPDGTLGTWVQGTSLPITLAQSQSIVTNNHVYLLGGFNGTSNVGTCYMALFSSGLNDYSVYYNGTITLTDPNNFKLPDLTNQQLSSGTFYLIKI